MQTAMLGNNYKWNNDLKSINNTGFKLAFVPKFKKQSLGIYAEYQQYTNYTYLKNKLYSISFVLTSIILLVGSFFFTVLHTKLIMDT